MVLAHHNEIMITLSLFPIGGGKTYIEYNQLT